MLVGVLLITTAHDMVKKPSHVLIIGINGRADKFNKIQKLVISSY